MPISSIKSALIPPPGQTMELDMTTTRTLLLICLFGLTLTSFAEDAAPVRVSPSDAKNHLGQTATVCGKVVNAQVSKYGIAGHGKPVTFDVDQTEPNRLFYFIAFATPPADPKEVIGAYSGKRVCVTGKITTVPAGGPPFIMAADHNQIKVQAEDK